MADTIDAITAVSENSSAQATLNVAQPTNTAIPTDSVLLSDTAEATLLQEKGATLAAIASALGLTIAEVEADLGISPPPTESATTNTGAIDTQPPVVSDPNSVAALYVNH